MQTIENAYPTITQLAAYLGIRPVVWLDDLLDRAIAIKTEWTPAHWEARINGEAYGLIPDTPADGDTLWFDAHLYTANHPPDHIASPWTEVQDTIRSVAHAGLTYAVQFSEPF